MAEKIVQRSGTPVLTGREDRMYSRLYPLMEPGPELDLMNQRATTFVRRVLEDDGYVAQVLEALGLGE